MTAAVSRRTSSPRLRAVVDAPPRRPRRRPRAAHGSPLGVVDQVRVACRPENRLAALLGAALGGFVPVGSYQLAHNEVTASAPLWTQLPAWLVAGALVFSALSVFGWTRQAFGSSVKALGFCVLLEGTLVGARTPWLTVASLAILVFVNAAATGCRLARA